MLSYSRLDSRFAFGFDPTGRGRGGGGREAGAGWGGREGDVGWGVGLSRHNTAYTRNCAADTDGCTKTQHKGKLESSPPFFFFWGGGGVGGWPRCLPDIWFMCTEEVGAESRPCSLDFAFPPAPSAFCCLLRELCCLRSERLRGLCGRCCFFSVFCFVCSLVVGPLAAYALGVHVGLRHPNAAAAREDVVTQTSAGAD